MSSTADLQFTVLAAEQVYTNELTPVTAVPWPDRYTNVILPYATVNFSEENLIWDFGDGTTYSGVSAEHVYNWPGEYKVSLTIIDEFGEPVISTHEETIVVKDFILTQLGFRDLLDVIDIPSGRLVSPITVDFTLSWQNYTQKTRTAPQCTDEKQHLMNKGTDPGYWMCGENHPGYETVQQPEVTEFPIYTFNLFASGAEAQPLDIIKYNRNKYSHLNLDWSFHSATPSLSTQPVTEILATRTDFVTGSSGDVNTYDLLYYKPTDNNEYIQTTASDPQGVFVGLSGNVSFYYRDDVTKCSNSRNEPVLITVELDQKKIFDQLSVDKRNLSQYKYTNTKPLIINNVKPRVNEAIQLGVTSIGLSEFEINKNKWEHSIVNYTITIQDAFNFNILDTKELSSVNPLLATDVKLELLDSTTMEPITNEKYIFEQIASELGHLRGQLKFNGVRNNLMIRATTTYNQISGYKTDTIAPWLNSYRPELVGTGTTSDPEIPEQGSLYRYYYTDVVQYSGDQLTNNFTNILTGAHLNVDTNGVISDVIVLNPGENLTQPPRITVEDTTGDGAQLVPRFNIDGGIVSDIIVLQGGRGYSLTPTIYFTLGDANATVPNATAVVDYNHRVELIAVQPSDPGIIQPKTWGLEYGESGNVEKPPRIVEATTRQGLTRSRALSAMTTFPGTPRDIKLDNNGSLYIATENKIVQVDPKDLELTNIYDDNGGGVGTFTYVSDPDKPLVLEVDLVNVYISNGTRVTALNKVNNNEVGNTQDQIIHDIQHILLHYNDNLYCLTDAPGLVVVDKASMLVQDSISLPSGNYSDLTTTVDGKIYTVKDTRYLYSIDVTNLLVKEVYDFGPTASIQTICGDSRGTIWLPDNTSRKLWAIDVVNVHNYNINNIPGEYEYGSLNYSEYPTPGDGIDTGHVLRAKGDWTGFHWLQKFGIIRPGDKTLVGYSSVFDIHSKSGTYNISKKNEDHDQAATIKSYATQPWMVDQHNLWDEAIKSIVGDKDSEPTGLGKQIYERIANFTNNNTDIDECTIDNIHNHALLYDVNIQYYNLNYPPTLKRILDLCSIKHSRLFGTVDYATKNYDMYIDYTIPDIRENLGREMNIYTATIKPGQKIVAYERFSKEYTTITVTPPTSGNLDKYSNLVDIGIDNKLHGSDESFPLSAYNVFWQWDLIAPVTVKGVDITDYYAFYTYNESTELKFAESVIDWSNQKTLLTPTLSSFDTWQQDTGILDNIIEHQLRVGLDLFKVEYTDTDGDGIPDIDDLDDDDDGTPDVDDIFPYDPTEDTDTDGDGTGDNADPDDDNDGTPDVDDPFPKDPTEDTDTDGDGTGDNEDTDDDDDGTPDVDDPFPKDPTEDTDTDGDGTGDNADPDDDNDGTPDVDDDFPKDPTEDTDTDGDGTGDNEDTDDDDDGTPDVDDDFPKDPTEDTDTDGDGTGDNEDTDDDDDGTPDVDDDFPKDPTEDTDTDGDGTGDNADTDDDDDGTPDVDDDFPKDPTEDTDTDGDGTGDNADPDDDNDGTPDVDDAFPTDPTESSDEDGDGIGDNTDILKPRVPSPDDDPADLPLGLDPSGVVVTVQEDVMIAPIVEVVPADIEVVVVPTWTHVNIEYGDLSPGATNTMTFDFKPNVVLPSGQTIRLIGLVDFVTPDNSALPISGPSAGLFGGTAQWEQSTGTLTLTVASGQQVPNDAITFLTFDLVNPAAIPNHQLQLISP